MNRSSYQITFCSIPHQKIRKFPAVSFSYQIIFVFPHCLLLILLLLLLLPPLIQPLLFSMLNRLSIPYFLKNLSFKVLQLGRSKRERVAEPYCLYQFPMPSFKHKFLIKLIEIRTLLVLTLALHTSSFKLRRNCCCD